VTLAREQTTVAGLVSSRNGAPFFRIAPHNFLSFAAVLNFFSGDKGREPLAASKGDAPNSFCRFAQERERGCKGLCGGSKVTRRNGWQDESREDPRGVVVAERGALESCRPFNSKGGQYMFVPSTKYFKNIYEILQRHQIAIGDEILFSAFNEIFNEGYKLARDTIDHSYGRAKESGGTAS
jgi:hypothetical protein